MQRKQLLDHGYLELVESWGSDERIVEAARMSTGKGFLGWGPKCRNCGDLFSAEPGRTCPEAVGKQYIDSGRGGHIFDAPGDEKLLRYLWEHKHTTPFETGGLAIEVGCPAVVVWQWVRHRTMTYNILSGRYTEMPSEDYLPTKERIIEGASNTKNKQATGKNPLVIEAIGDWLKAAEAAYAGVEQTYQTGLAMGIPKEVARLVLPFARYTRMRVHANLRNWLAFLTLRMAETAQYEIRVYAHAVGEIIAAKFPRTWSLFMEGRS